MSYGILLFSLSALLTLLSQNICGAQDPPISEVKAFLKEQNELLRQRFHNENLAAYIYNTDVTEENRLAMIAVATENAKAHKELALKLKQLQYDEIDDEAIKRQVKRLGRLTFDVLPEEDFQKILNAISSMQTNYATTTVCAFQNSSDCGLPLEPFINDRFRTSRDPEELSFYWQEWYDKAGTPMRENFKTYVDLSKKAALLNNFTSYAEDWISYYEDKNFEKTLDAAYNVILPLYKELHAYVRYRLKEHYGEEIVSEDGNIPMHLLGNLWGQTWDEAIELYTPYPNKSFVNVDDALISQGFTVEKMFELGNDFFTSLNMRSVPPSFWNLSVLERPFDREIICHASAWDMFQDSDVRIKMCTEVNTHYLYVLHHELGHIQYYLQYENQPTVFRSAPNPGFHEAIGDVIALSVATPKHLNALGLAPVAELDEESRINELFRTALKKIAFLPFAYTLDKFRYAVFRGEVDESSWNCAFWQMRSEFSGIEPPVRRTDEDFDPPAKYHIDADVEYSRYFVAHIFQFQFLKALCTKAGQYDPDDPKKSLDNCDIYKSTSAGKIFSEFLSLGSSLHWKEALVKLTGENTMNPQALLEFFKPLHKWLLAENCRLGVKLGWDQTDKVAPDCCPLFST